jgi:protein-tyrosine phosphatase
MVGLPVSREATPERHLRLPGTRNLRDVGGYPTIAGRRTRWRTLFRADRLDRLTEAGQAELLGGGLRQVIDLRWPHELAAYPSVFAGSDHVRYLSIPLLQDNPPPVDGPAADYRRMVDERGDRIAAVVGALLEPGGLPAVIGCAGGKDRTGVTIAVILDAIGVPADRIVADYLLTGECFARPVEGAALDDPLDGAIDVGCRPEVIADTVGHLRRRYRGGRGLLRHHGLTEAELDRLATLLTEPVAP